MLHCFCLHPAESAGRIPIKQAHNAQVLPHGSMPREDGNNHFYFLHVLPIKSLPCLRPGISLQALYCWRSVQFLIASLAEHLGNPRAGCGPSNSIANACLASLSTSSMPRMLLCPGTHMRVNSFIPANIVRASRHSATSPEVNFGLLSALSEAWLSEKIRIRLFL